MTFAHRSATCLSLATRPPAISRHALHKPTLTLPANTICTCLVSLCRIEPRLVCLRTCVMMLFELLCARVDASRSSVREVAKVNTCKVALSQFDACRAENGKRDCKDLAKNVYNCYQKL